MLDLGSGSGRDAYVCAALVGQQGHVTGVDFTEEQLEVGAACCAQLLTYVLTDSLTHAWAVRWRAGMQAPSAAAWGMQSPT